MSHRPNCKTFLDIYKRVYDGPTVFARGMETKELRNVSIEIDSMYPITSFKARKFNLNYAKKETLWYLRGNRHDVSICEEAGAWNTLIQPDGGINSNYGQVIFTGPKSFDWVIEELIRDPSSRRAVMVIGDKDMLTKENTDHRCTMYISYHIRDNELMQTVHMRSNDVVFGMTNDIFFYGYLHQMVWASLKRYMPSLNLGSYTHNADSLHIYAKHFKMTENILSDGVDGWYYIDAPVVSSGTEVDMLRFCQDRDNGYSFSNWLKGKPNDS
jgi:thymidylate synthase